MYIVKALWGLQTCSYMTEFDVDIIVCFADTYV